MVLAARGEVVFGGVAAFREVVGVVDVAVLGGPVTSGVLTDAIAGLNEIGEGRGWPVASTPDAEDLPGVGFGDDAAPHRVGVTCEFPPEPGGDGAIAGQLGGVLVESGQSQQVDIDIDDGCDAAVSGRSVEQPVRQGVGA
jgi:hypothetical protein